MTITSNFTIEAYVDKQMFHSSRSKLHQKRRLTGRLIVSGSYLVIGILIISITDLWLFGAALLVGGIVWWFYYPEHSKRRYKRHFKAEAKNKFEELDFLHYETELTPDAIRIYDPKSESKLSTDEIKEIIEFYRYYYIDFGSNLLIQINKKDIESENELVSLLKSYRAPYNRLEDYKWS